jgi:prepilin-type N-terminal cleavage/methylation domain-containing protein
VVRKAAFTLIELIFAIVIIAITVVSLPMMNQAVSKGIDGNLVQEVIFAATTKLNEALSANWDENSIEPDLSGYARVIDTDGNCDTHRHRDGHINQSLHRRCLDSSATGVSNSDTNDDVDALEDMEVTDENIFIDNQSGSASGYKDVYTYTLNVTPSATFGGTTSEDIKEVTIEIKNSHSKTIVKLKTYSCNIGEVDYYSRNY